MTASQGFSTIVAHETTYISELLKKHLSLASLQAEYFMAIKAGNM